MFQHPSLVCRINSHLWTHVDPGIYLEGGEHRNLPHLRLTSSPPPPPRVSKEKMLNYCLIFPILNNQQVITQY